MIVILGIINYSCPVKIDDSILEKFDQNLTYIFELIGKNNRQKVPYLTDELVHIGPRNNNTLKEFAFKLPYFRTPRVFDLHSLKECEEYLNNINEFIEGFVIVDKNFNRLKIKTERYLKTVIPSKEKIIQTLLMNEKFDSDFPENYFDNEKRSIEMYKKELHAGNIKSFIFRKNKMLNEDEWIKQNLNNVVRQIIKNKYR
ncbi:hypothetical protein TRFO_42926 [Tritrichomonas foetus]|uniref:Uncharacterized protein n=1 Tax=Tritrichomonas foetus TaxID=1144522 RepID=A0A1J4KUV9_9EUKA|nr:hypothetical protein TRFO_42926 [Tritrichomonas foetus]|eukprot:OHT14656.1 hypothetical protein TRFO_42926 [Tritrichomonas foetus]